MKQPRLLVLALCLSCTALMACSTEEPAADTGIDVAAAPFAIVTRVEGELWQGEKRLAEGDSIDLGGEVEVRAGYAVVSLSGIGSVRLYPKARLRVLSPARLKLLLGKLWASIAPQPSGQFEIETDNAVAGVRGTEFGVELRDGATRVAVREGRVAVHNRAAPERQVVVAQAQQTEVRGAEPPSEPAPVDAESHQKEWGTPAADAPAGEPVVEDAPAAAQEAGAPVGPKPGARSDREAFEKHEAKGRAQEQKLKQESRATEKELKKEEETERKGLEGSREDLEKRLEEDVGMPKKGKGGKSKRGSLKGKSIRRDDDEMEKFLE